MYVLALFWSLALIRTTTHALPVSPSTKIRPSGSYCFSRGIHSARTMSSVAAEAFAQNLYRRTPLIKSDPLTNLVGKPVYLKLDCLQSSGSFKDRGMAHLCLAMRNQGKGRIVSSSGGNAGLAAATVARQLRMECAVVVPVTTQPLVIEKLRALGAAVRVTGANWNAADAVAREMVARDDQAAYVPPYEHELLWKGHSTVVDEIFDEIAPSTIILSVGGGGLLCGVLEGLERLGKKEECNVIAAETEGASSFAQAHEKGELVQLSGIDSVATSLGALQVSPTALQRAVDHARLSTAICTDAEAVQACLQLARDHRILVEPACGASLAVLYSERLRSKQEFGGGDDGDDDGDDGPIVVEVCGGSGVNLELLQEWKRQFEL